MRYRIIHETQYSYSIPVRRCYNLSHMIPRDTPRQSCTQSKIRVDPSPAQVQKHEDYFGNTAYFFAIQKSHDNLCITAENEVEIRRAPALAPSSSCAEVLARLQSSSAAECLLAREFILDSPMIRSFPALRDYAAVSLHPERPFLDAVRDLNERIYRDFTYDPGFTTVATPLQDVLEHKRGVCQDFAHFAIGCLRAAGFPARYVSGYLETLPPPGKEKLIGADATHAWFAVYSPETGWVEFDPTNNKPASEQHIVTAWGRDYSDVTPLRGVIFGGGDKHELRVAVTVQRLD
ncbi:transglutaminase family protein [Saccharophagus sp. K07]|jgi:transglutaminase-like putative cysteine protease|uniref:transglutaminase family protein n=1 Tax=Saccharophagus sp. K07 TaxID=2283636 RepID=UPI001651E2F8|nr:transglutaminase family protein [Saccharophagus sp. K07]MBC6906377.1 transglutaminase family protein [Saccharophagus sp. K07]